MKVQETKLQTVASKEILCLFSYGWDLVELGNTNRNKITTGSTTGFVIEMVFQILIGALGDPRTPHNSMAGHLFPKFEANGDIN